HARLGEEPVVVSRELLDGHAVVTDPLDPIAALPAKSDGDDRPLEVSGRLDEIAREHAETARIDRERFVDAELHAEIRDVRLLWHQRSGGAGRGRGVRVRPAAGEASTQTGGRSYRGRPRLSWRWRNGRAYHGSAPADPTKETRKWPESRRPCRVGMPGA